jgi:hypothetical protein
MFNISRETLIPKVDLSGVRPAGAATDELHDTIKKQIEAMNRSSVVITRLTWAAVFIGFMQVLLALAPFAPALVNLNSVFQCTLDSYNKPSKQGK